MKKFVNESSKRAARKSFRCVLSSVKPASDLGYLIESDVITADMVTDDADIDLGNLLAIADKVCVEKRYDEDDDTVYFDLSIEVSDPDAAEDFYNWIIDNGYAESDEEVEEIAPGIMAYINGDVPMDDEEPVEDDFEDEELEECRESVSSRFSKYRKLVESEDDEDSDDDEDDDKNDDDKNDDDNEEDVDNDSEDDEDTEEIPVTAIIIEVKKGDEDKCKDELIDAGIDAEYIDIVEPEEDDDVVQIKVGVEAIDELKTYLDGKGIDLEEKIGGEISQEDDGEGETSDDEEGDDKDDDKGEEDDIPTEDLFGEE